MIAHKTARGTAALERLKVFEGIPPPYDMKKRMVVPQALRVLRLRPGRKYCTVGRLSREVGWKYADVVDTYVASCLLVLGIQKLDDGSETLTWIFLRTNSLEERRKVKSAAFFARKKVALRQVSDAKKNTTTKADKELATYGH